jgi:type IV pilus assembly protein PilY1
MKMIRKTIRNHKLIILLLLANAGLFILPCQASAASMNDYCAYPNFISQPVPPLVMFEAGRDHKFYYEAFNDATDIDEDGMIDLTYKHSIDYYGYFDHHKCYTYSSGEFDPVSKTSTKFCSAGQWSGNILNWMTMSRMDVLKKVLYGGHRSSDSNVTVLERVFIPEDAHSWGKEFTGRLCKQGTEFTYVCQSDINCDSGYTCEDIAAAGNYLIPFDAAAQPTTCSATTAINNIDNKITVARYRHPLTTTCGTDHSDLMYSFATSTAANFIDTFTVTSFLDTRLSPTTEHYNDYNIMIEAEFNVTGSSPNLKGNWQFFVDSNDGAEVEIDGKIVASYYGCHPMCSNSPTAALCDTNQLGTVDLSSSGYKKIIVRTSNHLGPDGVTVWYRTSTSGTWYPFPCTNAACTSKLGYRTVDIPSGAVCTIQNDGFINDGTPVLGPSAGRQHLFCSTTTSINGAPYLRMIPDNSHRIWEWASKEGPVCAGTFSDGGSTGTITDYTVRVKVCDSNIGLESNCKAYGGSSYKPVGLLQKYGENSTGDKICSKTMTKPCTSDSDCTFATEGQCMYKADMYFGMMTTSYTNNLSGGVLRKNIGSILDETNFNNGYFQTSENVAGNIIMTYDRLKTVGFRYSDYSYQDTSGGNCGWITSRALSQGECRMWGNPIGEMMYESLRYFAGKNNPTSVFDYSGTSDSGLSLSHPTWGYKQGNDYYPPYSLYPRCSRPFMLVLSDVNPSYDYDQLPGSAFSTFAEDTTKGSNFPAGLTFPMLNMNVSTLADIIGTTESINNNSWFIGESGSTNNFLCTPKTISNLSAAKGLCAEEPTKKGTYYSAAVAYYGKTKMKDNTGIPNTDTFVIALSSPLADMKFKAGSNIVTVLPLGKSVSGCTIGSIYDVYTPCASKCTLAIDTTANKNTLTISNCASNAYCPSNQIVDMYIDSIKYDNNKNVVYAKYRINFEDVEQGADHDMDAIVSYEICTKAAVNAGYGTCGDDTLGSNDIEVIVDASQYASGCIDQVMGFVISGTTEDGVYLVVKDKDVSSTSSSTPTPVKNLPLKYSRTFTTTGTAAGLLKNPLWYAAKWGGFDDTDGDGKPYTSPTCGTATPNPKCSEWDKDGDGVPDNYFLVVNPQKLEDQMNAALTAMLAKASSGTAASVLASGEGSGANLIQAVFYPLRKFKNTAANMEDTVGWTGRLTNMWYYVDPKLASSNIREDDGNSILNLKATTSGTTHDYIVSLYFDNLSATAKAHRWEDPNGDGVIGTQLSDVDFETLGNLWEAGTMLWKRDVTTAAGKRKLYTTINGTSLLTGNFSSNAINPSPATGTADADNSATLASYMSVTAGEAKKIIDWVQGVDVSGYRSRTIKIESIDTTARVWKLGDIVNSTPKIASWLPLNKYNIFYLDDKYGPAGKIAALGDPVSNDHFTTTAAYKGRGMVFAGGNDGMLHAFKLGTLQLKWSGQGATEVSRMVNPDTGDVCKPGDSVPCGTEMWTFIPKNALPYLKYLADPSYCHLYTVDLTPFIVDASINGSPDDARTVSSFRTILIGGMRFGGACKNSSTTCTDCVKTPIADVGYSSYFALDITDQNNPTLLWEFSNTDLGFATTGPTVVRISGKDGGVVDSSKNGNWFVIFGSGPTGPINTTTHQFMGSSNQNLKLFILDLKTGTLKRTIDTGISNAFAGSLYAATADTDMLDYQDELLYVPYIKKCTADTAAPSPFSSDKICKVDTWTNGGVGRLVTKRNPDPSTWAWSTVIDNIGPVTSAATKILDKDNRNLWVYFGTGRYYYTGIGGLDDADGRRFLFGVKDPCYTSAGYDLACTSSVTSASSPFSGLTDVTNVANVPTVSAANASTFKGWYLALDPSGTYTYAPDSATAYSAERVITDPLASAVRGLLFFTTYKPSADLCAYGGKSFIWAMQYNTGGPPGELKGTALIQVSTGAIEQKDLSKAFTDAGGRKSAGMSGKPPEAQGLSIISNPPATKKVIHIKER